MYYINNFLIYSIFGFILEIIICYIFKNSINSGILYGPWTPVYGVGILIIIYINNKLKKFRKSQKYFLLFIFSFLILTIIEFIGGYLIEYIFNDIYWDYSSLPLHIGKYISIEISTIWSILSIIYVRYLKPFTDKISRYIPPIITIIVFLAFIVDFIITIITKQKIF